MRHIDEAIEGREIYDRTPRPRGFSDHKQTAVEARGGKRSKLHRTLGNENLGDLPKRNPFGGRGVVGWHRDGL